MGQIGEGLSLCARHMSLLNKREDLMSKEGCISSSPPAAPDSPQSSPCKVPGFAPEQWVDISPVSCHGMVYPGSSD